MLLHPATFLQRQWSLLTQEARRKAHLANVMDKAAQERAVAILGRKTHATGNVATVDRHGTRMTRGISIARLECCDERHCEREVRTREHVVRCAEFVAEPALALVEGVEPLEREGWYYEQEDRYGRDLEIREDKYDDHGGVHEKGCEGDGRPADGELPHGPSSDLRRDRGEE